MILDAYNAKKNLNEYVDSVNALQKKIIDEINTMLEEKLADIDNELDDFKVHANEDDIHNALILIEEVKKLRDNIWDNLTSIDNTVKEIEKTLEKSVE